MRNFFGLTQKYIKEVYEQFFYMKYYAGWSLFELYSLPIGLRNFYVEMLIQMKQKQKEAADGTVSGQSSPGANKLYSPYTPPAKEGF